MTRFPLHLLGGILDTLLRLKVGCHDVDLVKRFIAAGALPHAVRDPIFDAFVAEHMTARLQDRVFEVAPAYRTHHDILNSLLASIQK